MHIYSTSSCIRNTHTDMPHALLPTNVCYMNGICWHTRVNRPVCLCRSESSCRYVATLFTETLGARESNSCIKLSMYMQHGMCQETELG